ncbi:MAG: ribonuclease III [Deltaproteobacteria bacterium]|nr:ribonuclease III [Deltaproteobacteria bacterium]
MEQLRKLEEHINYRFDKLDLLNNALTHRSFCNENPSETDGDNERLEFLGDAVLGLGISDLLMKKFPAFPEGKLSKLRSSIVNEQSLADIACLLMIGDYLRLGKGEEQSGGRKKPSLLSDALEAVIAAVYLDGGFAGSMEFIDHLFSPMIAEEDKNNIYKDYKTALQELSQTRFKVIPQYTLASEYGPDHDKTFEITLTVAGIITARGMGKSKKEAEQQAAKQAIEELETLDAIHPPHRHSGESRNPDV